MSATILYRILFNIGSLDAGTAEQWFLESDVDGEFLFNSFSTFYPTFECLQDNACDLPFVVLDAVYYQILSQLADLDCEATNKLAEDMTEQVWVYSNFMCSSYDGQDLQGFATRFKNEIEKFDFELTPQMQFFLNMMR
jgi:hypothetical protein